MDRTGANFFNVLHDIKEKLKAHPLAIQLPIGEEENFFGMVDLIEMKAYEWDEEERGISYDEIPIPEEMVEEVNEYRKLLVETLAEFDEDLMIKYFEDHDSITPQDLIPILRKATIEQKVYPVLCGSSFKNKGVQPLIDAAVMYLPSPLDTPDVEGINPRTERTEARAMDEKAPFAALAFKIATDPFVGKLTFIKVYSGKLNAGEVVYNVGSEKRERVSKILEMHSNKQNQLEAVTAGNIVALVGMKEIKTGDTLCDEKNPISLENITFPEPVIQIAIEPKTKDDENKLMSSLAKLSEEDPTFVVRQDEESGQLLISGMGELHLEILLDRLKREFNVQCSNGKPRVAYKEAILEEIFHTETYKRQTGGKGSYASMKFSISPTHLEHKGFTLDNQLKGAAIPKEFIAGAEKGFKVAMLNGKYGFALESLDLILLDGNTHPVDSDALSFEICAKIGFREAIRNANVCILEPIMKVEVVTPDEYMGNVSADLNRRRAVVEQVDAKIGFQVIKVQVPLSEMFGYVTGLRSISSGRATYSMEFLCYARVPAEVEQDILQKGRFALL
jgi:elongation factor G